MNPISILLYCDRPLVVWCVPYKHSTQRKESIIQLQI